MLAQKESLIKGAVEFLAAKIDSYFKEYYDEPVTFCLNLYGSRETGLSIKSSDLDLVLRANVNSDLQV